MGLFDSVYAYCPVCKDLIEMQSKSGHCMMEQYPAYDVPVHVLHGLTNPRYYMKNADGYIQCDHCGAELFMSVTPTWGGNYVIQLHERIKLGSDEGEIPF